MTKLVKRRLFLLCIYENVFLYIGTKLYDTVFSNIKHTRGNKTTACKKNNCIFYLIGYDNTFHYHYSTPLNFIKCTLLLTLNHVITQQYNHKAYHNSVKIYQLIGAFKECFISPKTYAADCSRK